MNSLDAALVAPRAAYAFASMAIDELPDVFLYLPVEENVSMPPSTQGLQSYVLSEDTSHLHASMSPS